ncbi:hypothetical protein JOQ06_013188 [Pogonophryne albipinna]|uniref:Uncharacterized protein n=1 Tax=Pogonophryne albipinna TaxID=1090488 RepID=A0AAD6FSX1_9TELE|nr:hypothetical protein JOQ06_013188 [Pogonophryne albipinna]
MERGCSAGSDKTLHIIGLYCSQTQTSYRSVTLIHRLPKADNPSSNSRWCEMTRLRRAVTSLTNQAAFIVSVTCTPWHGVWCLRFQTDGLMAD